LFVFFVVVVVVVVAVVKPGAVGVVHANILLPMPSFYKQWPKARVSFLGGFCRTFNLVFFRNHGTNTQKETDNNNHRRDKQKGREV